MKAGSARRFLNKRGWSAVLASQREGTPSNGPGIWAPLLPTFAGTSITATLAATPGPRAPGRSRMKTGGLERGADSGWIPRLPTYPGMRFSRYAVLRWAPCFSCFASGFKLPARRANSPICVGRSPRQQSNLSRHCSTPWRNCCWSKTPQGVWKPASQLFAWPRIGGTRRSRLVPRRTRDWRRKPWANWTPRAARFPMPCSFSTPRSKRQRWPIVTPRLG